MQTEHLLSFAKPGTSSTRSVQQYDGQFKINAPDNKSYRIAEYG